MGMKAAPRWQWSTSNRSAIRRAATESHWHPARTRQPRHRTSWPASCGRGSNAAPRWFGNRRTRTASLRSRLEPIPPSASTPPARHCHTWWAARRSRGARPGPCGGPHPRSSLAASRIAMQTPASGPVRPVSRPLPAPPPAPPLHALAESQHHFSCPDCKAWIGASLLVAAMGPSQETGVRCQLISLSRFPHPATFLQASC
jgi:hypothetical protein